MFPIRHSTRSRLLRQRKRLQMSKGGHALTQIQHSDAASSEAIGFHSNKTKHDAEPKRARDLRSV